MVTSSMHYVKRNYLSAHSPSLAVLSHPVNVSAWIHLQARLLRESFTSLVCVGHGLPCSQLWITAALTVCATFSMNPKSNVSIVSVEAW